MTFSDENSLGNKLETYDFTSFQVPTQSIGEENFYGPQNREKMYLVASVRP